MAEKFTDDYYLRDAKNDIYVFTNNDEKIFSLGKIQIELKILFSLVDDKISEAKESLNVNKDNYIRDIENFLEKEKQKIEDNIKNIEKKIQQDDLVAVDYFNTLQSAASTVNAFKIAVNQQKYATDWKNKVNRVVDNILQRIVPRDHKPYLLFVHETQKALKADIKKYDKQISETVNEPVLSKYNEGLSKQNSHKTSSLKQKAGQSHDKVSKKRK